MENIDKLVNILYSDEHIQNTSNMIINTLIKSGKIKEEKRNDISAFFLKYIGSDEVKNACKQAYEKYFNNDEIGILVVFYSTDIGKKLFHNIANMTEHISNITERVLNENEEELLNILND